MRLRSLFSPHLSSFWSLGLRRTWFCKISVATCLREQCEGDGSWLRTDCKAPCGWSGRIPAARAAAAWLAFRVSPPPWSLVKSSPQHADTETYSDTVLELLSHTTGRDTVVIKNNSRPHYCSFSQHVGSEFPRHADPDTGLQLLSCATV